MSDAIVLSYHDALLRRSDLDLLKSTDWINDNLIEFWFEYLSNDAYKECRESLLCFSPSLSQLVKLTKQKQEVEAILEPLNIGSKELLLIPINDSNLPETPGGSHWSLLVYRAKVDKFEHYDSSIYSGNLMNHAKKVASKLHSILIANNKQELNIEAMECTQQADSYNCGIHLICNSEAVCRRYLNNDDRQVRQIASPRQIQTFRQHLVELIESLKLNTV